MAEKRPQRSTRGKRHKQNQEEQKKQDALYATIFGQPEEEESQEYVQRKPIGVIRAETLKSNIRQYPYARSHHYYYEIDKFRRVGTTSYVEDPNYQSNESLFIYHFNDKSIKQHYRQKGINPDTILNRKYIGLPAKIHKEGHSIHSSKNPCHQYLFINEDRKWRIDQLLIELRCVRDKPKILQQNLARQFAFIKRDFELASLYDPSIPFAAKSEMLLKKIQSLEKKRQKMEDDLVFEDWLFYHSSQNQKFFNEHNASELSMTNIVSEITYLYHLAAEVKKEQTNQEAIRKIGLFFGVYNTIGYSSPPMFGLMNQFYPSLLQTKVPPAFIMNFSVLENFQKVQQILSIRVLSMFGETSFYELKYFWTKVFGRELAFDKEFVPTKKEEYISRMRNVIVNYHKREMPVFYDDIKMPSDGQSDRFLGSNAHITLSSGQYMLIYLAYYIYERVGYFNVDEKLIGEESFEKYQYKIVELIGQTFTATFEPAVKRFAQILGRIHPIPQVMFDIFWEFSSDKVGLIWLKEKEEWETEEEPDEAANEEVSEDKEEMTVEKMDRPEKKVKEV